MSCTKTMFWRSERTATKALLDLWRKFPHDPVRREIRVYYCEQHKRWHMTSKPTGAYRGDAATA